MARKSIRQRKRIRRVHRNRKIAISCILIAAAVGTVAPMLHTGESADASEEVSSAVSQEIPHMTQKGIAHTATQGRDTKTQKEEVPDRSQFAVEQGENVGALHQTEDKIVYLTVDDGPSQNTQAVLDILDQYQIKATFFVTGIFPQYRGMIKKAYDKGHTIGLHSYTHNYASVYSCADAYFQDLNAIGQIVGEEIGYVPCFIRFPGGSSNTVSKQYAQGIMTQLAQEVQKRGYQYYDWNVSSQDSVVHSVDGITAASVNSNENNVVLLLHDGPDKQTTVEALPDIIEHYRSRGYSFRPVDKTSYISHHNISN